MSANKRTPMRISIVTISYNQVAFIERAIRSIVEQDYANKEYIVVDPGSSDGSRDVIARHSARIDRVILEPDDGPADGLNKGFRCASGDVFGFINSDDALLPGALTKVADAFTRQADVDVLCGAGFIVDEYDSVLRVVHPTRMSTRRLIYGGATHFQPATFFRRRVFEQTGGFNVANRTCWDGELLIDAALKGAKFGSIDAALAVFRRYPGSISGSGRLKAEYERDQEGLFRKVMRRERDGVDRVVAFYYRALKQLERLPRLCRRLAAATLPRPRGEGKPQ